MILPPGFEIGQMRAAEATILEQWATAEGWNPGVGDLAFAYGIDPEAFIALRESDELVGGGSIFRHNASTGFMGLFILHPNYRKRGLGSILWHWRRDRLIRRLGPKASIGMDGVLDMVPFYERGGFRRHHLNIRFQGTAQATAAAGCINLSEKDTEQILALDHECFGSDRAGFVAAWLARPGMLGAGIFEGRRLTGFGIARPSKVGYKIGPLYAQSAQDAEQLLDGLCNRIVGKQVQIDAPDINSAAEAVFRARGWLPVFRCARLYLGTDPNANLGATYGVCSLEFG